ncbi:hypothetical protein [Halalkalicoccus subterraneus]|uniref:hypothetical protein n=1 Tax=Halalkalicoccus subterraneus TaxID=2675002 RepID=UPI000EFCA290|nr:hypothetical protein [Halalkalicoccus subterraneus]
MVHNPIERNAVTRFILGFAIITLMSIGGEVVAGPLVSIAGPVAGFVGMFLGALAVFVAFAHWYVRYDASFEAK